MSAEAVCRVEPVDPLPDEVRAHPLAHEQGVSGLVALIVAGDRWRALTLHQRAAVRSAYQTALRDAVAEDLTEIPLPRIPEDTHPLTVRSLTRRGLVADGRLTPAAVELARLAVPFERHRQRRRGDVDTVQPRGDLL